MITIVSDEVDSGAFINVIPKHITSFGYDGRRTFWVSTVGEPGELKFSYYSPARAAIAVEMFGKMMLNGDEASGGIYPRQIDELLASKEQP